MFSNAGRQLHNGKILTNIGNICRFSSHMAASNIKSRQILITKTIWNYQKRYFKPGKLAELENDEYLRRRGAEVLINPVALIGILLLLDWPVILGYVGIEIKPHIPHHEAYIPDLNHYGKLDEAKAAAAAENQGSDKKDVEKKIGFRDRKVSE